MKRAFIKTWNSFLKSALNTISVLSADAKNFQTNRKAGELWIKEIGYPSKGSTYLDLRNGNTIANTDQVEAIRRTTKIELKYKDLEE